MALLEEINRVIDQLESKKQDSGEGESDNLPDLDRLVNLLCEPIESDPDSGSKSPSDSTEEIHYLVNLLLEELESSRNSSRDSSDATDEEMDRLVDLLLDLLKSSHSSGHSSGRSAARSANPESKHSSLSEMPSGSPGSQSGKLGDTAENSEEDQEIISEFLKSLDPRSPEAPESVARSTSADRLAEQFVEAVKHPTEETVTGPQEPEPLNLDIEPDPEEVARSVDFLRQLMFPNESSEEDRTKSSNSQDDVFEKADSPAESKLLDDFSSSQAVGNSSESPRSDVPDLTLDRLINQLIEQPSDQLVEPPSDQLIEPPSDQLVEPPSDQLVEQPSDQLVEPPSDQLVEPPSDQLVEPPSDQLVEPPSDQLVEQPSDQLVEQPSDQLVEQPSDQLVEQPSDQLVEQPSDQLVEQPSDQLVEQPSDQLVEQPSDQLVEQPSDQLVEQPSDQLVEQPSDQLVEQPSDQLVEQPSDQLAFQLLQQLINQPLEPDPVSTAEKQQTKPASEAIENSQQPEFVNVEVLKPLEFGAETTPNQSDFDMLQSLLVNSEVDPLRKLNKQLDDKLSDMHQLIHDPKQLINLLMPVIAELLNLKVEESKEDISQALAPIIDRAIQQRALQDKHAMSSVLATLIPEAISYQIKQAPEEIAKALAPEIAPAIREQIKLDRAAIANVLAPQMGEAIKEQIKLEQEAMVDALYPVIGSTVAKYIAEAIRDINQKIATALSGDGIRRKIRAKLQGVSEGELVFKESIGLTVQGIFLIHKQSGLIISEAQPEVTQLESEMVAGMLTAIRSFVNDCIMQSGEVAELDDIDYGLSTIKLEVAGYCYMALVLRGGDPPKQFVTKMRHTLSQIVLNYGHAIEEFDGDPDSVPQEVHELIADLIAISQPKTNATSLPLLQLLTIAAIGLIFGIWGWTFYQTSLDRRLETQVLTALNTSPELAIYGLNVEVEENSITLKGKLPNSRLAFQAEEIVKDTAPNLKLNSQVIAVEIPPDPVFVEKEVNRIAQTLNQMAGISITVKYEAGKAIVDGIVVQETDSQTISQAFATIPGVNSVISAVQVQPLTIETRIYFEQNSSKIKPEDVNTNLVEVKRFLTQYPQVHLNIVGHSDRTGKKPTNQRLALRRSETVQKALISLGLSPERLHISANPEPPIDVDDGQPEWKHRCVIFYPIIPPKKP